MTPWIPDALCLAPALDENLRTPPPTPRSALLINPFYPKDPHASFGKHVLTPSLALTSIAASTPESWDVRYWDENLLLGPPPCDPFPQVVGITVHLTFAQRAYALAGWYRRHGAKVVLGGLHVTSCPEEAAPHADAIAIGEGVQLWGRILHRDWNRYDTAHVVFKPRHLTPQQLAEGYAWCHRRLFSHSSIWARRPHDVRAVMPYLAMSYLYKRSNRLWHLLIRHQMTAIVWRPLVEWTRRRHVGFRRRLADQPDISQPLTSVVPAGV